MSTSTYSRWKYAEEEAQRLHSSGKFVAIFNTGEHDHVEDPGTEDEEVYTYDEFVVVDGTEPFSVLSRKTVELLRDFFDGDDDPIGSEVLAELDNALITVCE